MADIPRNNPYILRIIDPHLHLFNLLQGDYAWLKSTNPPLWPDKEKIALDWQESDLMLASPIVLAGFVHIEAGFDNNRPWRELAWLHSHCTLPFRSVACVDLTSAHFSSEIAKLSQYTSFVGVRHILDEDAVNILSHKNALDNLGELANRGILFEAQCSLICANTVKLLLQVLSTFPNLQIVINHAGWPPQYGDKADFSLWKCHLNELSKFPNVWMKLSGWEMSKRDWTLESIRPIVEQGVEVVGEDRVMLGSNFPLCTWRMSYADLWRVYSQNTLLNDIQNQNLCYTNAQACYQFDI